MADVVATDEFKDWYDSLGETENEAVTRVVDLLEARGVSLGFPHSSAINGSKHPLRELRVQAGGRALRVFYAFDRSDRQSCSSAATRPVRATASTTTWCRERNGSGRAT